MKRALFALLIALAGLQMAGCATTDCPGFGPPVIIIQTQNQFDLRVRVDGFYRRGPLPGAKVNVAQTGDHDFTASDGWTRSLAVPPNGRGVDITVSWPVRSCFACGDYTWRSVTRFVPLQHGITEFVIGVDDRPF